MIITRIFVCVTTYRGLIGDLVRVSVIGEPLTTGLMDGEIPFLVVGVSPGEPVSVAGVVCGLREQDILFICTVYIP